RFQQAQAYNLLFQLRDIRHFSLHSKLEFVISLADPRRGKVPVRQTCALSARFTAQTRKTACSS
ncbi:MAG: hypothetical protein WCF17_05475, partial [Terracidiphilus sp.]